MRNTKKYLTIRKFSELTHTTVDTLKHYDDIGILKPAVIGENRYRYYLPEQSLDLTRILFSKNVGIPLKEIRKFIKSDHPDTTIDLYGTISDKLQKQTAEMDTMASTISNLRYYYNLSKIHPPKTFFTIYLPEWFIISSEKSKISHEWESAGSDVANTLFMKGFSGEKWPHYLLQALFTEEDIRTENFAEVTYFLKTDHPELYDKSQIQFIPNGEWLCMLFYTKGKELEKSLRFYLQALKEKGESIQGGIFIMDIVNNLITSNPNEYCTMIYARKECQAHEEY